MVFPTRPCPCIRQLTLYQQELLQPGVSLSPWVLGKFLRTEMESVLLYLDSTALKGGVHDVGVVLTH